MRKKVIVGLLLALLICGVVIAIVVLAVMLAQISGKYIAHVLTPNTI